MITLRPASERGQGQFGWLDSRHTFSFGHYHDERYHGYSDLRAINEDRVQPGEGFPTHSHRDMEILSYVLEGTLEHQDGGGGGGRLQAGDVQLLSAGRGVTHSEYNASRTEPVHFLQIWLLPREKGLPPSYESRHFSTAEQAGRWCVIAAGDGRPGALALHQDATVLAAQLEGGQAVGHRFDERRRGWVQVARGAILINGQRLGAGDGAALVDEAGITIQGDPSGELLLFDLR